jgi:hypothetical protein
MARRISRAGWVPYTARERRATAYHEAGHVVACLVLGLPFKDVTINRSADKKYDGRIRYDFGRNGRDPKTWTREKILAHATQFLCGLIAEEYAQQHWRRLINLRESAESDQMQVMSLLLSLHRGKATKARQRDGEADLMAAQDRAEALVKDNFRKIRKVALALQKRGTLTFDEIVALV